MPKQFYISFNVIYSDKTKSHISSLIKIFYKIIDLHMYQIKQPTRLRLLVFKEYKSGIFEILHELNVNFI